MKTLHKNKIVWIVLTAFVTVWACSKKPTDYRAFLDGQELTYPGKIVNPNVYPGNLRLLLTWNPSPDPSVVKYVVYWNNYADSVVLNATSHSTSDTVKCIISPLAEYAYSFFIYSYDNAGNRSILTELDNAHVYGPIYQSALYNRQLDNTKPPTTFPDGSATLYFLSPDTINITTKIKYVNNSGDTIQTAIAPNVDSINLPNFKSYTKVLYRSSYIPKQGAIDTFTVNNYDSASPFSYVMCDKSLFNAINLPNDLQAYDGSTYLARIWDGNMQPRAYPNIWHSSGSPGIPGTITFDMGKLYQDLGRVEETGRNCCHNPLDFEIWGIADTTGAITSLLPGNGGWKADMQAKGWTLLKEVVRGDDGINPYDVNLVSNPPPVRYIIIRILTTDGSGYANMSQITFWNIQ